MQSGAAVGMHTLAGDLADMVRKGLITETDAQERVNNKAELAQYLGF
jgi:Tfp pilus assembly pilus retraction ATPase PilT